MGEKLMDTKPSTKGNTSKFRLMIMKTCLLVLTWVIMGMGASVQTSTLPDLRNRLNTTVETLSYAFTMGSIGGMLGASLTGIIDRLFIYSELILGGLMLGASIITTSKPLVPTVFSFGMITFIDSIIWTLVNAAGTVLLLSLWGESGGSAMQTMHFGFPVGALIGGLLAVPFVSSSDCTENVTNNNITDNCDSDDNKYIDDSNIEIPFAIVGVLTVIMAFTHIGAHFIKLSPTVVYERTNSKWSELITPSKWANGDGRFGVLVVLLLSLFYFFNLASSIGVMTYIVTYAVDSDLEFSNAEAAIINSAMNAFGGVGRAIFIPLASYFSVTSILLIAVHGQLLGGALMSTVGTKYKVGLWVSSCFYAFFRDPLFPAPYAWANHYMLLLAFMVGVTGIVSTISGFIMNLLQGYLYTNTVIESIFYTCVLFGGVVTLVSYAMCLLTRGRPAKASADQSDDKVGAMITEDTYM